MKNLKVGDKVKIGVMGRLKICTIESIYGQVYWILIQYTLIRARTGEQTNVWGFRPYSIVNGVLKYMKEEI